MREGLFVNVDGAVDVVGAIENLAEQQRRRRQRGLLLQRVDQEPSRFVGLAEQVRREPGAQQHGGLVGGAPQCLGESRSRLLQPARVHRVPSRARLLRRRHLQRGVCDARPKEERE
jgi:hypothetical protein